MTLTVLTGASRGLGLALARALLEPGNHLLTLSRRPDPSLEAYAQAQGATLEQWSVDLSDPIPVAERLQAWLRPWRLAHGGGEPDGGVALINNAAQLAEPGPLAQADLHQLSAALRVSLEAPVLLTAAFLSATASWTAPRRVLNVSSGLGRWAMAGAASYCAAKAGVDHFSRVVALEEAAQPQGARIVSLAPGVIATDMQEQLRGADASRFSERQRFVDLHAQGGLDTPESAAAKVLAVLRHADFGREPIGDVRGRPA